LSDAAHDRIDGSVFATALISGIHRVIAQQELLNRINVFPVADSDTGTNLSLSLSAALPVLRRHDNKHLGALLAATADALLDGARGNSGAIVAQFFQGLSDRTGEAAHFTTKTFSRALRCAADYARDALSQPREGTILSAISAFADNVEQQLEIAPDQLFPDLLGKARSRVEKAVDETPAQLDVLRKAGVVDAGAKGFAELVGGFADYVIDGEVTPMPDTKLLDDIETTIDFSSADNASTFRFCTECLVTGASINRRKLREELAILGDSLVLAGSKRKAKIHIHADDPEAVFETARRFGVLSGEKADDMNRQQNSTQNRSRAFAVISDSGADITDDDMERLDIHMVPCRIQFGDRGYLDKVSISTDEFYTELATNPSHPTTSQPAPGDFRRQFQFLASHFSDVLSINLTSKASGTYEGARAAAARSEAPGRIHVIDSLNASVGQGMLTVMAAECAERGLSIDETVEKIRACVPRTRTFALLYDLRFAVRGGRLPRWVKTMTDLLHLVPILCTKPDGRIALDGCLFGRGNRVAKFARFVARRIPADEPLAVSIGHAVCREDAMQLADELGERLPNTVPAKICDLGTGIGVHGGPGTLIVSTQPLELDDNVSNRVD
jgi:DegV family protein with EDD domain